MSSEGLFDELLVRVREGGTPSIELRTAARPGPWSAARIAADVLRFANELPPGVRALGTELFRGQFEFNHALLDALEDREWRWCPPDVRRARSLASFRALIPQKPGLRGGLTFLTKSVTVLAAWRWFAEDLELLERSNLALTEALLTAEPSVEPAREPLRRMNGLSHFVFAQTQFLDSVEGLLRRAPAPPVEAPPGVLPLSLSVSVLTDSDDPIGGMPTTGVQRVRGMSVSAATGDVVVRVPRGVTFVPGGWESLLAPFQNPAVALSYGDRRIQGRTHFAQGWTPEALWAANFVGECFAVRRTRLRGITGAEPALEWLLRPGFSEREVARMSCVLTEQPAPSDSTLDAEHEVVEQHLEQQHLKAIVGSSDAGRRVTLLVNDDAKVSIVVPLRDQPQLLRSLWRSLTSIPAGVPWELICVDNGSREAETAELLGELTRAGVRVIRWDRPFNFSELNNLGAREATGTHLLFLNNDTEVLEPDWLSELVGYAQLPDVGVVAPRLLYADGSVQHAGVVVGLRGLAGHAFARWRPQVGDTGFGRPDLVRGWSAVTGACLLMRRPLFHELGGFDERLRVSGNDIELCLRARAKGLRVLTVGHVTLAHLESRSRGRTPIARENLVQEAIAYRALLVGRDPAWHPSLSWEIGTATPRESPRDTPLRQALSSLISSL